MASVPAVSRHAVDTFDLKGFRNTAPYVYAHRGRTFVLCLDSAVLDLAGLDSLIQDIAQLHVLGARLALVFGADLQVGRRLEKPAARDGVHIIRPRDLPRMQETVGAMHYDLQARLSRGLIHTAMAGMRLRVLDGNLVAARPVGVREGQDFGQAGEVRRVEAQAIRQLLEQDAVALIPPLGYSATGEIFSLQATELACAVAQAIGAHKLLYLHAKPALRVDRRAVRSLTTEQAQALRRRRPGSAYARMLGAAVDANLSAVERVHLLDVRQDGVLLRELFTHEGCGVMISRSDAHVPRRATAADIGGILGLVTPLVEKGVLVERTRRELEVRIHNFWVIDIDGLIVACASLHPLTDTQAELACLAVHPEYHRRGHGAALLRHLEQCAHEQGVRHLYAHTIQAMHWFRERGFAAVAPQQLPRPRARFYNRQRKARIFVKSLEHPAHGG